MNSIVEPNYDKSILNIVSSIMNYYDLTSNYTTLRELDQYLTKDYDNVLLMVFDGMGISTVDKHLHSDSLIKQFNADALTSVYPCTTTAAMTAYYSGLSPLEHGWLGWSLYFKEFGRTIDTFLNTDSYDGSAVGALNAAKTVMPVKTIYESIMERPNNEVQVYTVNPTGIEVAPPPTINISYDGLEGLLEATTDILAKTGKKFIMTYSPEPDTASHKNGCGHKAVNQLMLEIDKLLNTLKAKASNTLIIVSADHGLTDIETVYLNDYEAITQCLVMPPTIEPRCASFFLHQDKKDAFVKAFEDTFDNDYTLMSKEEFLDSGYLGHYSAHPKTIDFIGDYVAIATGNKILKYRTLNLTTEHHFKAHHAGLTSEEMLIPLIIMECL